MPSAFPGLPRASQGFRRLPRAFKRFPLAFKGLPRAPKGFQRPPETLQRFPMSCSGVAMVRMSERVSEGPVFHAVRALSRGCALLTNVRLSRGCEGSSASRGSHGDGRGRGIRADSPGSGRADMEGQPADQDHRLSHARRRRSPAEHDVAARERYRRRLRAAHLQGQPGRCGHRHARCAGEHGGCASVLPGVRLARCSALGIAAERRSGTECRADAMETLGRAAPQRHCADSRRIAALVTWLPMRKAISGIAHRCGVQRMLDRPRWVCRGHVVSSARHAHVCSHLVTGASPVSARAVWFVSVAHRALRQALVRQHCLGVPRLPERTSIGSWAFGARLVSQSCQPVRDSAAP